MFAYCGNNPINFKDSAGTSKEPAVWEIMGFKYDGSMRDFKKLNQGLPPYEFERWLAEGGSMDISYTENLGSGIIKTTESITYIPADKTNDYYVNKIKENQKYNVVDDISFVAGTATMFIKNCPSFITVGLYAIDLISWFNEKATLSDTRNYINAMNGGTGVLVVVWSIYGPRCVGGNYTSYYSWDGRGDPFAK